MNWKNWLNKALYVVGAVVATAGAVVALPAGFVPAAVVAIAMKVVIYGATVGVVAAKVLPGHGDNAPGVAISPAAAATQVKP